MSSKKSDLTVKIRVTPRSSRNEVRFEGEQLKVFIHTIPEDGKANRECISLLSDFFSVPKSDVSIDRGLKSRDKTVTIRNVSAEKRAVLVNSGISVTV